MIHNIAVRQYQKMSDWIFGLIGLLWKLNI